MSLTFSLFKPPLTSSKSTTLTSSFLHGSLSNSFSTLSISSTSPTRSTKTLTIKAMKLIQGKVVCATNDKTVAVEVTRLAPHRKYKRRVRIKKRFQAHDPDNIFKVGDLVQLERCRPISKTKTFLAVKPQPRKASPAAAAAAADVAPNELGLPLQSQQGDEDNTV